MGLRTLLLAGALACVATTTRADDPSFAPGRPGSTETAISVPKGKLQIETEIAHFTHDDAAGVDTRAWSAGSTSFRYGLAHGVDAEVIVAPYRRSRVADSSGVAAAEGFGDVTVRARRTFAGQDGDPSLAVIGYVTAPTAADGLGANDVEGGLIVTGAFDLNPRFNLAWTAGVGAVSADDGGYDTATSGALTLNVSLAERWDGYVEIGGGHDGGGDSGFYGAGMTLLLARATQLDAGVDLGAGGGADDLNVFAGWAHRF